MASTSNNQTIQGSTVGAVIQGDNNTVQKIIVNKQNPVADFETSDFKVPRCIETFHGREDKIKELDTLFFKKNETKIVIHGLPGFGKTEMAKQFSKYCERKRKVKHTFWIEAENEAKLQQSCHELRKNYYKYKNVRCLYIFDNAINRSSLFEYESESKKHLTLITSVDGNWDGVVPVQLDSLPLTDAVQLLRTLLGCDDELKNESFEELANAVSCVPLGLQIVGGFVREGKKCLGHSFNLEHYVKNIEKSQFDVLRENIPASAGNTYKKTVYSAMTVSLDKVRDMKDNRAKLALNILYVCAFVDPDDTNVNALLNIPTVRELVQFDIYDRNCRNSISDSNSNSDSDSNNNNDSDTNMSFEDLTDDSQILFKHALGLLINLSFVSYRTRSEDSIIFHRLTQSFLKDYLESRNLIEKYFTACLHTVFFSFIYNFSGSVQCYCEEYSDIVYQFFKTQNSKFKQTKILENLASYGCVDCLKKIFKCLTENLVEFTFHCIASVSVCNQIALLECLLECININSTNEDENTILHFVAYRGNIESIKYLISRDANVNAKNNAGDTPLFVLAKGEHYSKDVNWGSILKIFKFNKDLTNNNNETLLHAAVAGFKSTLVEELILNHGMDINRTDLTNRTPIEYLFSNSMKYYDSLFSKTVQVYNFYDYDKLLYLTFKVLNKHGAKLNAKLADTGFDILSRVIKHDDLELLKCALQQCDVHSKDKRNKTLLHNAAEYGNLTIIKFLIKEGLNVNTVDSYRQTAAFKFVRYVGSNDISNMSLVEETLDVLNCQEQTQITDTNANSMLYIAASEAHKDLVQLLIERYKFNVNQQNINGNTPLHSLIKSLNYESNKKNVKHIVKILIQAGADTNIVNKDEETPLQMVHRLDEDEEEDYNVKFLIPLLTKRKICCVL